MVRHRSRLGAPVAPAKEFAVPSHRSEAELLVLAHLQNVHEQGNPRGDYPADPASLRG